MKKASSSPLWCKLAILLGCTLLCIGLITACSGDIETPGESTSTPSGNTDSTDNGGDSSSGEDTTTGSYYTITLDGNAYTTTAGDAIAVDGSTLVLIKGGTYRLSGERQGQIRVRVAKTEEVTLILDGLTVSCADSAALYVESADRVYIEVPEGKTATMTDAASYVFPVGVDKPNACIYGSDDLTFRGQGTLTVNGNYNNGIGCKNDIVIESGTIIVGGSNNAIKGNGSVTVTGTAHVTVTEGEDGIKSDSLTADKGYVLIDGNAVVDITCSDDALQAVSYITVGETARVTYTCGGDPTNCDGVTNVVEGSMVAKE